MSSKAIQAIQRHIPDHYQAVARAHPGALSVSAVGIVAGIWWIASDYASYKALGRGGSPYNIFGWFLSRTLGLFSIPQRRIKDVPSLMRSAGEKRGVKTLDLPERIGMAPEVQGVVPQRQMSQRGSKTFQDDLNKYFCDVAAAHSEVFFVASSLNEGGTTSALFVRLTPSSSERTRDGEVAHVHPIDGALHVPLSVPDCVEVLEKGWGVRHRLAGRVILDGFTLIYSPRSLDEVEVVKMIIRASAEFKSGCRVTV